MGASVPMLAMFYHKDLTIDDVDSLQQPTLSILSIAAIYTNKQFFSIKNVKKKFHAKYGLYPTLISQTNDIYFDCVTTLGWIRFIVIWFYFHDWLSNRFNHISHDFSYLFHCSRHFSQVFFCDQFNWKTIFAMRSSDWFDEKKNIENTHWKYVTVWIVRWLFT